MVTSMEVLGADSELSFHQVKQYAEQRLEEIILNRLKSKEKNFAKSNLI
jgi:hypothetical protein